jgi:hypothetical protein
VIVFVAAFDDCGEEYIQHYFATEKTACEWLEKQRVKMAAKSSSVGPITREFPEQHPHNWAFLVGDGMFIVRPQEILTELPQEIPQS